MDISMNADMRNANATAIFCIDFSSKEFFIGKVQTEKQEGQLQGRCCNLVKIRPATNHKTVPVAARSRAWVCGRSLAGIVGSNFAWGMNVCLL
jgi:hypothetical protein